MIQLFPEPEQRKPSLLRVGKSTYQFPLAATEIHILNERGRTVWQVRRDNQSGPIRWNGIDSDGQQIATGDYVCQLIYPDGQSVYIPFVFAA